MKPLLDRFAAIFSRKRGSDGGTDADIRADVATLLALAAKSDGIVSTGETERVVVILRRGFGLQAGTALALMTKALHDLPDAEQTASLLAGLGGAMRMRQKEDVVVMLLEVISADGIKEASEMALLADTVTALGIPDANLQRAYRRYFDARRERAT